MENNNPEWEPQYEDWDESRVEMSDTPASTNSSSRSEYGVMLQQPEVPYRGNGAIFWIDPQHIYFRYDWGLWFPVTNDDAENCSIICKRRTGTLYLCTMTSIKHIPVKVYHIDRLPEELFGNNKENYEQAPTDNDTAECDEACPSWDSAIQVLVSSLTQLGIDVFPNVSMGDGYAHYAFSSENRAVVIQPFLGQAKLERQCRQLLSLRDQLLADESNGHVMAALYFSSEADRLPRIKGIARITPSNLTAFRKFLKPDRKP